MNLYVKNCQVCKTL